LEEAERLSKIVGQLLEISRLEAGETLADRSCFDLSEMTRTTLDQMKLLADEKDVRLRFEPAARVHVNADPLRLQQVVINLVDNAIKCTPSGGSIRVSTFSNDNKAMLEVADTGIGIPATALPHIFERFYRVDKARSRQLGGAGLGLAIVKSICAAYGGSVSVESIEAQGSVFRVDLPLEQKRQ
jgi:signal transduction histidine kinase